MSFESSPQSQEATIELYLCFLSSFGLSIDIENQKDLAFTLWRLKLTFPCVVVGMKYLEKYMKSVRSKSCKPMQTYLLVVISLALAAKFLNDRGYANTIFATVTGTDPKLLNQCERDFLKEVNYDLFVSNEEYFSWLSSVLLIKSRMEARLEAPSVMDSAQYSIPNKRKRGNQDENDILETIILPSHTGKRFCLC